MSHIPGGDAAPRPPILSFEPVDPTSNVHLKAVAALIVQDVENRSSKHRKARSHKKSVKKHKRR